MRFSINLSFKLLTESAFEHFPRIAMDLNFCKNSIASFRYGMENYGRMFNLFIIILEVVQGYLVKHFSLGWV